MAGDNSCLKEFFTDHSEKVISALVNKTKCSTQDAEDFFIDAILSLREKILHQKITDLKNVRGYIYTTCYNMWLNKINQEKKLDKTIIELNKVPDNEEKNESLKEENLALSQEALSMLGTKCQGIIKLYYFEKLSMKDIANVMDFSSPDVAKSTKSRCFKKLVENINKLVTSSQKTPANETF